MASSTPRIRWDVVWPPDVRELWREELEQLLCDLDYHESRGRSRLADIDELRVRSSHEVVAAVQGTSSRPYRVRLWLSPDEDAQGSCSCPYADDEGDCKHQWAVAASLAAALEAPAALAAPSTTSPVDQLARLVEAALTAPGADADEVGGRASRVVWRARLTGVSAPLVEPFEQQERKDGT
ncbi:MAG: SWIM zinc finger family protein [Planctomycetes bacterium]|nr:SWIM zinc finger family protein [Planctomycetota bacterium]